MDLDGYAQLIGQALQFELPQSHARTVRSAAVGGDDQPTRERVANLADLSPPTADRLNRESRGVVVDADGDPTRVGCVRVLTQTDGEVFREVLVALSDAERSYSYTFVSSPVPVRNHQTTLRVLPITDGDRSYVEWSSRFEIDPQYEAGLVDLMNQNFLAGLRNLAEKLGRNRTVSP